MRRCLHDRAPARSPRRCGSGVGPVRDMPGPAGAGRPPDASSQRSGPPGSSSSRRHILLAGRRPRRTGRPRTPGARTARGCAGASVEPVLDPRRVRGQPDAALGPSGRPWSLRPPAAVTRQPPRHRAATRPPPRRPPPSSTANRSAREAAGPAWRTGPGPSPHRTGRLRTPDPGRGRGSRVSHASGVLEVLARGVEKRRSRALPTPAQPAGQGGRQPNRGLHRVASGPDEVQCRMLAWFSDSSSGKPSRIWARRVVLTRLSSPEYREAGLAC